MELWPAAAPDEPGTIGEEYIRMSPALDRKQTEVTTSTKMVTNVTRPTLTIYQPAESNRSGTALLIFPGGGYWNLYWEVEGEEVAAWATEHGITAILVKYRVPRRPGEPERLPAARPLQDAERAIRLVRSRAAEWGVLPNRIGVIGFSAGGHLAVAAATQFDQRAYAAVDDVDQVSCRPDFAVSVYPGYLQAEGKDELAEGIRIPEGTPPVFFVHGTDDIISLPENSLLMYLALKKKGVSTEMHLFAGTTHGFGVREEPGRTYCQWKDLCLSWLRGQNLYQPATGDRP